MSPILPGKQTAFAQLDLSAADRAFVAAQRYRETGFRGEAGAMLPVGAANKLVAQPTCQGRKIRYSVYAFDGENNVLFRDSQRCGPFRDGWATAEAGDTNLASGEAKPYCGNFPAMRSCERKGGRPFCIFKESLPEFGDRGGLF